MVLKRKLPTQTKQEKQEVEKEDKAENQFDMSIEEDSKQSELSEAAAGQDIAEQDFVEIGEKPEDFIPEELKAIEEEHSSEDVISKEDEKEEIVSVFENLDEDTIVDDADTLEDAFAVKTGSEENYDVFGDPNAEPAELPDSQMVPEEPILDSKPQFDSFEKLDANKNEEFEEPIFEKETKEDSFNDISWKDDGFEAETEEQKEKDEFSDDEIPTLQDDELPSVELAGEDTELLTLNTDAKKKLLIGFGIVVLLIIGLIMFGFDKEQKDRWSDAVKKDETKEETVSLFATEKDKEESRESTKPEKKVVDAEKIEDLEKTDSLVDDNVETQINLLEPEIIETTGSGKEIISATGDEPIPEELEEDSEEDVSLLSSISEEIEKQKKEQGEDTSSGDDGTGADVSLQNPATANKQVDDQLAEYRKLLAQEKDPAKKLKPAAFFAGATQGGDGVLPIEETPRVSKVDINGDSEIPEGYALTNKQVEGHQIIEYPQAVAREPDKGIRTLDDFRLSLVKKTDKRVRVPRHIKPALRNQGFPRIKVVSIVPNYGLIALYDNQKGILMIGDTIQGWELVGVYREYAEFKLGNRKHIISLTR